MTRACQAVMRTAAAVLVVATVLVPAVQMVDGGCASASAAAAGSVRAAIVVDFGVLTDAPGQPTISCVEVDDGANGFAVLAAAGYSVRVNSAGLVCAIAGRPSAPECGTKTPGGYRYWAYFHGGTSWDYASIGPGTTRIGEGSVEGWRFVEGSGNPGDPAPRAPSSAVTLCGTVPPTTAGGGAPGQATPPPTAPVGQPGGASLPATGGAPGAQATRGGAVVEAPASSSTTLATGEDAVRPPGTVDAASGTVPERTSAGPRGTVGAQLAAEGSSGLQTATVRGSGGPPVAVLLAAAAAVGIAVAAVARSRRRDAEAGT